MKRLVLSVILGLTLMIGMISSACEKTKPIQLRPQFEPFSFAIITDLHIGRDIHDSGIQDYGAEGWEDYNLVTGEAVNKNEGGFTNI